LRPHIIRSTKNREGVGGKRGSRERVSARKRRKLVRSEPQYFMNSHVSRHFRGQSD